MTQPTTPTQHIIKEFLCDGTRFKVRQGDNDEAGRIYGLPSGLNGRWVALVAADDDCHLQPCTQPADTKLVEQLVEALNIGIAKHWDLATDARIGDALTAGREALEQAQNDNLSFMDAEDAMFEQITIAARKSFLRHQSSVRGQQITRADGIDSHLIWAALEWAKSHSQANEPAPSPAQGDLSRLEPFVQGLGKTILRELQSAQKARE